MQIENKENTWRSFQSDFLIQQRKQHLRETIIKCVFASVFICIAIIGFLAFKPRPSEKINTAPGTLSDTLAGAVLSEEPPASGEPLPEINPSALISKEELKNILSATPLLNADTNIFFTDDHDKSFKITTSLNIDLQEFLLGQLDELKKKTRGKPRNIAFVVMEPVTGKIVGLAGFNLDNPEANPCYESTYPAASIFKIITAAAAVETLGFTPDTPLYFNGNKYTLYKKQLNTTKNKYTNQTSFAQAFAESINPVFGKISQNQIGKNNLSKYAAIFGFNDRINSEIDFDSGHILITEKPYQWAEIGCGFNTDTTISPVFGAMLASSIVNSGKIPVPNIVEHVTDAHGNLIYKWEKEVYHTAIKPQTAGTVMTLMERTISKGTASKVFRGYTKHKTLSKLTIGGKTGSLYNKEGTIKYDWFTGFGTERKGHRKLAVSIVVGHGKYYGTKASQYGKMIMEQYFKQDVKTARL